jgi:cytochrome c oxidase subunit 4
MHDATHASGHDAHEVDPHAAEHGIAKYVYVFLILCLLTGCSFLTYSEWWRSHFAPEVGRAFMMAVSCTKALLVIAFFMHLKYEADWKYVLTVPASIMSLLLVLALVPDIGLRVYHYSEERLTHAAEKRAHDAAAHGGTSHENTAHGEGGH